MMLLPFQALSSFYLLLIAFVVSQSFTLTSSGCIDPTGFDSCYATITSNAQQCYTRFCSGTSCNGPDDCTAGGNANCVTSCLAGAYQGWINCGMIHCWNRAYSCEFQTLEIKALQALDFALSISKPPYFFPPSGAAGACSCGLTSVFYYVYDTASQYNHCSASSTGLSTGEVCTCCAASLALSSVLDVCPSTSPQDSGLQFLTQMSNYNGAVTVFEKAAYCNTTADPASVDCTAAPYNFQFGGNTFYGPNDLPIPGTQSISDTAGTLTAPLSATIVWSLVQGASVLATAVAVTTGGAIATPTTSSTSLPSGSSGKTSGVTRLPAVSTYLTGFISLLVVAVLF